jgi:hypothetical protein
MPKRSKETYWRTSYGGKVNSILTYVIEPSLIRRPVHTKNEFRIMQLCATPCDTVGIDPNLGCMVMLCRMMRNSCWGYIELNISYLSLITCGRHLTPERAVRRAQYYKLEILLLQYLRSAFCRFGKVEFDIETYIAPTKTYSRLKRMTSCHVFTGRVLIIFSLK